MSPSKTTICKVQATARNIVLQSFWLKTERASPSLDDKPLSFHLTISFINRVNIQLSCFINCPVMKKILYKFTIIIKIKKRKLSIVI